MQSSLAQDAIRLRFLHLSAALALGWLAVAGCKSTPVQSPETIAAQNQCPSSERVLEDLKQIEDTVGALNSLSTTPDPNDVSRCTVDVQLGKGSVLWASASLRYQRVDGRWKLIDNRPTFEQTLDGIRGTVELLVEETCGCAGEDCLKGVNAKAARILDPERTPELFESDPAGMEALGARVGKCTNRILGIIEEKDVPARAAQTEEAKTYVKRMSDAARVHHATPRSGKSEDRSLPESVGPTPPLGTCCTDGGKCKVNMSLWQGATWTTLDFAMRDPHYYSYEFETTLTETGKHAYSAIAHGDLDCDGVYSRFSIHGEVTANGEIATGELISDNALE